MSRFPCTATIDGVPIPIAPILQTRAIRPVSITGDGPGLGSITLGAVLLKFVLPLALTAAGGAGLLLLGKKAVEKAKPILSGLVPIGAAGLGLFAFSRVRPWLKPERKEFPTEKKFLKAQTRYRLVQGTVVTTAGGLGLWGLSQWAKSRKAATETAATKEGRVTPAESKDIGLAIDFPAQGQTISLSACAGLLRATTPASKWCDVGHPIADVRIVNQSLTKIVQVYIVATLGRTPRAGEREILPGIGESRAIQKEWRVKLPWSGTGEEEAKFTIERPESFHSSVRGVPGGDFGAWTLRLEVFTNIGRTGEKLAEKEVSFQVVA